MNKTTNNSPPRSTNNMERVNDGAASPSSNGNNKNNRKRKRKCKKQKFRDYFIEPNGCRSKKPYNMAKCVSKGRNSNRNSCVATKTKLRMARFVCEDGRQFKKQVEIVRKCGRMHNRRNRRQNNF